MEGGRPSARPAFVRGACDGGSSSLIHAALSYFTITPLHEAPGVNLRERRQESNRVPNPPARGSVESYRWPFSLQTALDATAEQTTPAHRPGSIKPERHTRTPTNETEHRRARRMQSAPSGPPLRPAEGRRSPLRPPALLNRRSGTHSHALFVPCFKFRSLWSRRSPLIRHAYTLGVTSALSTFQKGIASNQDGADGTSGVQYDDGNECRDEHGTPKRAYRASCVKFLLRKSPMHYSKGPTSPAGGRPGLLGDALTIYACLLSCSNTNDAPASTVKGFLSDRYIYIGRQY
ncbi:hypothetical protein EVAR_49379_1 [Eumeta japonica]|uniref:Uncharacterized protein n=1 Tax=Eumeta variegata TaxID=151549 RepID=A0A4C1YL70_EUMVA|nr:hypothetical protein EVAR_49379_1 [Eumeta japonica]